MCIHFTFTATFNKFKDTTPAYGPSSYMQCSAAFVMYSASLLLSKTKGKTLEEIQKKLQNSVHIFLLLLSKCVIRH